MPTPATSSVGGFTHSALLYEGERGFVDATLPFIQAGLEAGEPTLVVVDDDKIALLRERLNGDAGGVHFADMREVGTNPARIIPAWREFVRRHGTDGDAVRGIGEPIWAGRSPEELAECHRHEALLNVAFADGSAFELLCPYDIGTLAPEVIEHARTTHPQMLEHQRSAPSSSDAYPGLDTLLAPFDAPLSASPPSALEFEIFAGTLSALRTIVRDFAVKVGMRAAALDDFLIAASEVAANSVRHAGGKGIMRLWVLPGRLICEVRDAGLLDLPLAGRVRPEPDQIDGRGLWLANQLCELVQIRSGAAGTTVRLHKNI